MANKKQRRFGNPARQAAVDLAGREHARIGEAARVAAERERNDAGCGTTGCGCGDACCS